MDCRPVVGKLIGNMDNDGVTPVGLDHRSGHLAVDQESRNGNAIWGDGGVGDLKPVLADLASFWGIRVRVVVDGQTAERRFTSSIPVVAHLALARSALGWLRRAARRLGLGRAGASASGTRASRNGSSWPNSRGGAISVRTGRVPRAVWASSDRARGRGLGADRRGVGVHGGVRRAIRGLGAKCRVGGVARNATGARAGRTSGGRAGRMAGCWPNGVRRRRTVERRDWSRATIWRDSASAGLRVATIWRDGASARLRVATMASTVWWWAAAGGARWVAACADGGSESRHPGRSDHRGCNSAGARKGCAT